MKAVSTAHQKNGVGKTALTIDFAAELARMGRRIPIVDMDEQCAGRQHSFADME